MNIRCMMQLYFTLILQYTKCASFNEDAHNKHPLTRGLNNKNFLNTEAVAFLETSWERPKSAHPTQGSQKASF